MTLRKLCGSRLGERRVPQVFSPALVLVVCLAPISCGSRDRAFIDLLEEPFRIQKNDARDPETPVKIPKPGAAEYELYNTKADPGETENLSDADDIKAQELANLLEEWLAEFKTPADAEGTSRDDRETRRLLKSLGYMNSRD